MRDAKGKLINDKYAPPNGPYNDSRKDPGEILWYTPQNYMHPNYTEGEETEGCEEGEDCEEGENEEECIKGCKKKCIESMNLILKFFKPHISNSRPLSNKRRWRHSFE